MGRIVFTVNVILDGAIIAVALLWANCGLIVRIEESRLGLICGKRILKNASQNCLVSLGARLQTHILPAVVRCSHLTDRIPNPGQAETARCRACRCKETVTGRGHKHQMDTPRTIGEVPGRSGSVDSRTPARDRLNRAMV